MVPTGPTPLLLCAVALSGLLAACADSSSGSDDDDGSAGHGNATSVGGSHAGGSTGAGGSGNSAAGGSTSTGGAGGSASLLACLPPCSSIDQCDLGVAPYDADNYACTDGACRYLGCNSDPECQSIGNFVCRDIGVGYPSCVQACTSVANCYQAQSPAPYDADNYACTDGWCHYLGCNSDPECQSTGSYICRDVGGGVPYCLPVCSTVADCTFGTASTDADNYACTDGWCHYLGCNSDPECQSTGNFVCH